MQEFLFSCPICRSVFNEQASDPWVCPGCNFEFPLIAGIPLLFEQSSKNEWQAVFDDWAGQDLPDWRAAGWTSKPRYDACKALFDHFMSDCFNDRVLDLGCGRGDFSGFLSENNFVVGVDYSPNMLSFAQKKLSKVFGGDVVKIPFAENQFDAVVCVGVIQHVDKEVLLKECARVVRPGGICLFETLNELSLIRRLNRILRPSAISKNLFHTKIDDLIQIAKVNDFDLERIGWTYAPTGFKRVNGSLSKIEQWLGTNFFVRFRKK